MRQVWQYLHEPHPVFEQMYAEKTLLDDQYCPEFSSFTTSVIPLLDSEVKTVLRQ